MYTYRIEMALPVHYRTPNPRISMWASCRHGASVIRYVLLLCAEEFMSYTFLTQALEKWRIEKPPCTGYPSSLFDRAVGIPARVMDSRVVFPRKNGEHGKTSEETFVRVTYTEEWYHNNMIRSSLLCISVVGPTERRSIKSEGFDARLRRSRGERDRDRGTERDDRSSKKPKKADVRRYPPKVVRVRSTVAAPRDDFSDTETRTAS